MGCTILWGGRNTNSENDVGCFHYSGFGQQKNRTFQVFFRPFPWVFHNFQDLSKKKFL